MNTDRPRLQAWPVAQRSFDDPSANSSAARRLDPSGAQGSTQLSESGA